MGNSTVRRVPLCGRETPRREGVRIGPYRSELDTTKEKK
jgi:hypothetical protein